MVKVRSRSRKERSRAVPAETGQATPCRIARRLFCLKLPDNESWTMPMFGRLRALWNRRDPSDETARRRLLRRFPNHLDLIDSREIPHEHSTGPDLSYYTESAAFYYDLIVESSPHLKDKQQAVTDADREMASIAYNRIVNATWGLIARGAESVPLALRLLRSNDRDHREAAANVFCGLRAPKRLPDVLKHLHAVVSDEHDHLVLDSLLAVLGNLQSRDSIPVLAQYILDDSIDDDTRDTAASSLGQILKKRFDRTNAGAVNAACDWLVAHGYTV